MMMATTIQVLLFCLHLGAVKAQTRVIPTSYVIPASAYSVNGSSATGRCSFLTNNSDGTTTCLAQGTSVLFDGYIPKLTRDINNMWASQLLTLQSEDRIDIPFVFSGTAESVTRIEVVMINCTQQELWRIQVHEVNTTRIVNMSSNSSCDSFVRVYITLTTQESVLLLQFFPLPSNQFNRLYIAEITFYGNSSFTTSPPVATIAMPTIPPTTATTPPSTTPTIPPTTPTTPPTMTTTSLTTPTTPPTMPTTLHTTPTTPLTMTITPTPPPDTVVMLPDTNTSIITTEDSRSTLSTKSEENESASSNLVVIILAVALSFFIILVCVVGVVLLLWRCYCAKHHKHNTTALGEGTHASPHPHSHPPPITLCEETGQALYSVVQDEAGEDEENYKPVKHDDKTDVNDAEYAVPPCHATDFQYDVIQTENTDKRNINMTRTHLTASEITNTGRLPQPHEKFSSLHKKNEYEYSLSSHEKIPENKMLNQQPSPLFSGNPRDQTYAKLSNNSKMHDKSHTVLSEQEDLRYSQVDNSRSKAQHSAVKDMYTQVNKKTRTTPNISTPTPVDQEYAKLRVPRSASIAPPPTSHPNTAVVDHQYAILEEANSPSVSHPSTAVVDHQYAILTEETITSTPLLVSNVKGDRDYSVFTDERYPAVSTSPQPISHHNAATDHEYFILTDENYSTASKSLPPPIPHNIDHEYSVLTDERSKYSTASKVLPHLIPHPTSTSTDHEYSVLTDERSKYSTASKSHPTNTFINHKYFVLTDEKHAATKYPL